MINLILFTFCMIGLAVCAITTNLYFTISTKLIHYKEYKILNYVVAVDYEKGAQLRIILKKAPSAA